MTTRRWIRDISLLTTAVVIGSWLTPEAKSSINPSSLEYVNVYNDSAAVSFSPSNRNNLPGNWAKIQFNAEYADADNNHANPGPYVAVASGYLSGILDLRVQDCATNTELQIRSFEDALTSATRLETHEGPEYYTAHDGHPDTWVDGDYPRNTHLRVPVFAYVNAGHRLGFEISQWPHSLSSPACRVVKAQFQGTLTN